MAWESWRSWTFLSTDETACFAMLCNSWPRSTVFFRSEGLPPLLRRSLAVSKGFVFFFFDRIVCHRPSSGLKIRNSDRRFSPVSMPPVTKIWSPHSEIAKFLRPITCVAAVCMFFKLTNRLVFELKQCRSGGHTFTPAFIRCSGIWPANE